MRAQLGLAFGQRARAVCRQGRRAAEIPRRSRSRRIAWRTGCNAGLPAEIRCRLKPPMLCRRDRSFRNLENCWFGLARLILRRIRCHSICASIGASGAVDRNSRPVAELDRDRLSKKLAKCCLDLQPARKPAPQTSPAALVLRSCALDQAR